jgi:hypothetical protein
MNLRERFEAEHGYVRHGDKVHAAALASECPVCTLHEVDAELRAAPDIPTADEAWEQMVDGLLDEYRAALIAYEACRRRWAAREAARVALDMASERLDDARHAWEAAVRDEVRSDG